MSGWFEVDRKGLKQLMEDKPKGFILRELIQNAWDEPGVTICRVSVMPCGNSLALVTVEDDAPEGFHDIRHAFTLFASTRKRSDAEKRGRFNLGEKQVLSLATRASITTTTGSVIFRDDGTRTQSRNKRRGFGSIVTMDVPMTSREVREALSYARTFIPPRNITTFINGEILHTRTRKSSVQGVSLNTEFLNKFGIWRHTRRVTNIDIYEVLPGERATLYEMGLPVVELEGGERYHINVLQRVPLNSDRDNVPAGFLTEVRAHVLNAVAADLQEKDASAVWTRDAAGSPLVEKDAFDAVMSKRFGENRVAHCPTDSESNRTAASHGYTVLAGGSLSAEEWENARRFKAVPSAGEIFKTARPEFGGTKDTRVPRDEWPARVEALVDVFKHIGGAVLGMDLHIEVVRDRGNKFSAWYGVGGYLTLNLTYLHDDGDTARMLSLLLHEIAHERCGDHKLDIYHDALSEFGAKMTLVVANSPAIRTKLMDLR